MSAREMNKLALLQLARTDGVGPITFRRLLHRFPDAQTALGELPALARAAGRASPPRVPSRARIEAELAALHTLGAHLICLGEPDYPALLAELPDAPATLTVLGDPALLAQPGVALVGARNASLNGRKLAADLAAAIAQSGHVVVSGLARGIDTAAHEGAMRTGRTIAVIAGGLDRPYPPENAELQARIAATGAVVAESPLGVAPVARHFPRRNRVIAGLALGTVVIEAAPRSGSLITARLAAEAGRDVFAVPGSPLDARCRGSNALLREGAILTETADDVLSQLGQGQSSLRPPPPARAPSPASPALDITAAATDMATREVLSLLAADPCSVDDLVRGCQLPLTVVMGVLADLELAGRLETLPGGQVALLAGSISDAHSA